MYKLLVVDDEYNIRDGLANAIPWSSVDVEVVGSAANGLDALAKVEQLAPDIVITDVNMDRMDGLELSDILRNRHPSVKVIILSGYDEFEYVRRALELKVYSYTMKPVRSKDLLNTVRSLIGEIEAEKKLKARIDSMEATFERNRSVLVERFFFDLMHGNIDTSADVAARLDFLGLRLEMACYACVIIAIQNAGGIAREQGMKKLQGLTYGLQEIARNAMKGLELWPQAGENGTLTLLVGGMGNGEQFRNSLSLELERAVDDMTRLLGVAVLATVGGVSAGTPDIPRSYREATLAMDHSALSGRTGILHIGDVPAGGGSRYIYPVEREKQLLRSLTDAGYDRACEIIGGLFDDMQQQGYTWDRMRVDVMGLLGSVSRKAMDMGVDVYGFFGRELTDPWKAMEQYRSRETVEVWIKNIIFKTICEIRDRQDNSIKSVIKKANEYLEENYSRPNISLATISDHLHLSQSYFSRLYKKETGESYIEALTRIRMDRAKALLRETNAKISDISGSVGYPDSKYFSTLFRKMEGLTPVEYREA